MVGRLHSWYQNTNQCTTNELDWISIKTGAFLPLHYHSVPAMTNMPDKKRAHITHTSRSTRMSPAEILEEWDNNKLQYLASFTLSWITEMWTAWRKDEGTIAFDSSQHQKKWQFCQHFCCHQSYLEKLFQVISCNRKFTHVTIPHP